MITVAASALLAFVAAEIAVYSWHRWISHGGLLRWVANDAFRRRHFHHHFEQYPPQRLRAGAYVPSWDITFGGAEVLLIGGIVTLMLTDAVRPAILIGAVCGVALHAALALAFHSMCHKSVEVVVTWRAQRLDLVSRTLMRIRSFHDAHHVGRGNYSLLIPIVDTIGGSRTERALDPTRIENELFPRFSRKPFHSDSFRA